MGFFGDRIMEQKPRSNGCHMVLLPFLAGWGLLLGGLATYLT